MSNERVFFILESNFWARFRLVRELTFEVFQNQSELKRQKKDSTYAVRREFWKIL